MTVAPAVPLGSKEMTLGTSIALPLIELLSFGGYMLDAELTLGDTVLSAMAQAQPLPVHFGYLGLALRIAPGTMHTLLKQLRSAGLINIDRNPADPDIPFCRARITAKGLAHVAALTAADAIFEMPVHDAITVSALQPRVSGIDASGWGPAGVMPLRLPLHRHEPGIGLIAS